MDHIEARVSFIIPALNEEKHIGRVLETIKGALDEIDGEILVIDNGSTDTTRRIAEAMGAAVFEKPNVTISALRNLGVSRSVGEIIVFIDADVYLEKDWAAEAKSVIESLRMDPMIVTGSAYGLAPGAGWLEKAWFGPALQRKERNYINGGHLIVSRSLFERIGGFSEHLETGEDYEFCQRAKRAGARIKSNSNLKVVHLGYPGTIRAFFRRERWHGRGDYASLAAMFSSIPALLSVAQFGGMFPVLLAVFYYGSIFPLLAYVSILSAISVAAGFSRSRSLDRRLPACSFLAMLYFQARALSFLDVLRMRFGRG